MISGAYSHCYLYCYEGPPKGLRSALTRLKTILLRLVLPSKIDIPVYFYFHAFRPITIPVTVPASLVNRVRRGVRQEIGRDVNYTF